MRIVRKSSTAVLLVTLCVLSLPAQQQLNNDAVVKLVKAGLSDELVVTTISSQSGAYDTSTDAIIALKSAGVSDKVVAAIIQKAAIVAANPAHNLHLHQSQQQLQALLRPQETCSLRPSRTTLRQNPACI